MKTIISSIASVMLTIFLVAGNCASAATYTITFSSIPSASSITTSNSPLGIDYGSVTPGSDLQPEVTITNTGSAVLQTGDIAGTDPLAAPFSIPVNNCANVLIQPGEQCSFMVMFAPAATGSYSDTFNIDITSDSTTHTITLTGQGGPAANEADIQVSYTSYDFGQVNILNSTTASTSAYPIGEIIRNIGQSDLTISSIALSGTDASDFTYTETCTGKALATGRYCGISISFAPLTPGNKSAEITIVSNDPDESTFVISLRGEPIGENDGVPAAVEDACPNNGDGNNDGVPDSTQNDVASLVGAQGKYVTFETDQGTLIGNMTLEPATSSVPGNLVSGPGLFDFTIKGITIGQKVNIGIILPAGTVPSGFYMYGKTTSYPADHWYNFTYDSTTGTGASILGNTSFTNNPAFVRSVVYAIVQDGGPGDADGKADGVITIKSGLAAPSSSSSTRIGSLGFVQLLIMLLPVAFLRRRRSHLKLH